MLGSAARFRELQEPVLEAIIKHKSPIFGVAGNSALFQLPGEGMASGTTIIITPLVSLQDHIVERCQQLGISYVKLDSRQCHPASQVVIVTQESAVSKSFGSSLNHLILQRLQQLQWQTKSASTLNTSEISDELLL